MSLKDKINEDLKSAMKAQDAVLTETLRSIRAEIIKMDKSGMNREMTPEEEILLLNRQVKMRKETIEMAEKAGRNDIADKEKVQLEIIAKYLPEQMSREEAEKIVSKILSDIGASSAKDTGKAMGAVMKELKGKIDGTIVQEIVKSKLNA
ncbi:MAG TPA: GatB/YqeY domain-containing protein [Ignavibacteria bacterium]|nr:GatB/YqeY domain-containing protein [Ignavibacteria bacterium]